MISFFRLNDPVRILAVLLLLFLLRLPVFIAGFDLLNPEFSWMLIGEKLNNGFTMYKDIQSTLGFLSALTYQGIDWLFGRSQLAYQLIATFLVGFQAIFIALHFNESDAMPEKGYLTAFFYMILSFSFVDFYTLSPVLLALTFLIPALGQLFKLMKTGSDETGVLKVGIYTGLASLFYFPSLTLIFAFLLTFLLFTKSDLRHYILLFFAYFFPILLFGIYFYWIDYFDGYLIDILYYSMGLSKVQFMSYTEILIVLSPLIVITAIATLKVLTTAGFVNFQQRCHALMIFWLVAVFFSILINTHISTLNLLLLLPPSVYFITHLYYVTKRKFFKILYFNGLVLGVFAFGYMGILYDIPEKLMDKRTFVGHSVLENTNQKILVLGNDLSHYRGNQTATSLINWHLDKKLFKDFSLYKNIITFHEKLSADQPEIIVDQFNNLPTIFERIPELQKQYLVGEHGFYYLKKE